MKKLGANSDLLQHNKK